jgi:hypothetical protein
MLRKVAAKVAWVGRTASMVFGLALVLALIFGVLSVAVAHTNVDTKMFHLDHNNNVTTALTKVTGNLATQVLKIDNNGTGPALSLEVGNATTPANNVAPMKVNSSKVVTNLNADRLDGKSDTDFYAAGSKVADSDLLDGKNSTEFARATSDGTGKAADSDLLDGKDESAFLGKTEKAADSDLLDGRNSSDFASAYKSTVVVSPVGTPQQNGTALKNALEGIMGASATNPYLLKIEPGVYDLGSSDTPLMMKPWVDIEGSGEGVTTLTATASNNFLSGTVEGAANAELRFLTVKNTGGGASYAAAIHSSANPFRLTHVTATASGGNLGNNTVNITGGTATLSQVNATASGEQGNIKIAVITHPGATATLNEVNATASGSNSKYGVNISGTATLNEVNATASGSNINYGVAISNGTATLSQVDANASGGGTNHGISNSNSDTEVRNSRIASSNETIANFGTISVGASQLDGGAVYNESGRSIKCVASYDENYDILDASCV